MNAIQQFDRFRATTGTTPDIQKARGAVHLPIEMIDMYNAEGNAATHRSAASAARVRRISRIAAQLDEGRAWIDEARPSDKKVAAEQIYARLQRQFEAVSLETDDGALDDLSQLVTDQMKDFIQLPSVPVAAAPGAIHEAPDVRSRAPRRASPVLIGTVVVLAILVIVGEQPEGGGEHRGGGRRGDEQLALVHAVGEHAGPGTTEEHGEELQRGRDPERDAAVRELEDEPDLRDLLHPAATARDDLADEVDAEVAGAQ